MAFWFQFEKIHSDDEIAKEDKYQYLLQETLKASRARGTVESYPATGDTFKNSHRVFKSTFGLYWSVYIRFVLALMMI